MNALSPITGAGNLAPVVFAKGGRPMTNSRDVARFVGKAHRHVLRDIDRIIAHSPDLGGVWFQEVKVPHPTIKGRMDRASDMTRDGAVLVISGYTGPDAIDFKLAYIRRFNEMEAELLALAAKPVAVKAHRRALPHTPPELAGRPNGRYLIDFIDGKIDRLVDVGISQVVDPASASSVAWFLRERVTQDVIPTALEVAARRANPAIPEGAEVKAVPAPFSPGSNLLLDLRSAMLSARVRLDRGEAPSILEALEQVFHYFNERNEGRKTSGAILDWNWNRAGGTYSRETGKLIHPVPVR